MLGSARTPVLIIFKGPISGLLYNQNAAVKQKKMHRRVVQKNVHSLRCRYKFVFMNRIKSLFIIALTMTAFGISADDFSGKWTSEIGWKADAGLGWSLTVSGTRMNYIFSGEGCPVNMEGTYRIEGKKLHYTLTGENSSNCGSIDMKRLKGICTFQILKDHPDFEKKLKCTGTIGSDPELYKDHPKEGTLRKIDGMEVALMGHRKGIISEDAFIRSAPNTGAKPIECRLGSDIGKEKPRHTLPPKHTVTVMRRTKTKVKVQNWENYWYYVDARDDWYSSCQGWGSQNL